MASKKKNAIRIDNNECLKKIYKTPDGYNYDESDDTIDLFVDYTYAHNDINRNTVTYDQRLSIGFKMLQQGGWDID